MPAPAHERPRAVPGKVVEVLATPCFHRGGRPTRTCFRSVVGYEDGGQTLQIVSSSAYRPARHAKGDAVDVLVETDGTAFIDMEWEAKQAELARDFASARTFPLWMGFLLSGGGAFGLLLAAGLTFWVDRSGEDEASGRG
jgi:hypothetical protein